MKQASLGFVLAATMTLLSTTDGVAQSGLNRTSPFLGIWCVQDDPARRALIRGGPFGLTMFNDTGATSSGVIAGPFSHQVDAPQWNLLHGTLSPDEESITWSNNTYWTRCRPRINIQGTWYVGGNPAQPTRINQHNGTLALRNEGGLSGTGTFVNRNQIAVLWSGVLVNATISPDQNRIDWDNGSYWTR